MMPLRASRAMIAAFGKANASAGITRCRKLPQPATGNQPSHRENTIMAAAPSTKLGREMPNNASAILKWSATELRRKPAKIPSTRPITTDKIKDKRPSATLTGNAGAISSSTVRPCTLIDGPSVPCTSKRRM